MHRRTTIVSLALAASLSMAACGGDDGGSELSRSDLVTKADAICKKAQADARAVPAPANIADANQAAAYFDKIAPITHKETQELDDLEPDKDVKSDWDAFVASQQDADDLLQTIKKKADAKDPSGQKDLARAAGTGQKVAAAAKKVGAKQCAQ